MASGPPSSSEQNSLLLHPQQIRSTADLQACICSLNGKCMTKNIVLKDNILFICVYHHERGDVDQIHRLQQITSMNITHSTTGTVFEPITSEFSDSDYISEDLISTYMSPWVTVENNAESPLMIIRLKQLLGIWFDFKGSTIDIRGEVLVQAEGDIMDETGTNMLGSDVRFSKQSTENFFLTALLMDQPCQSSSDGSLSVTIHDANSISFACTCDSTNSCYDFNIGVSDQSSTPSVRICIIPQKSNGETANLVRITQLKLEKGGPCGFPWEVVNDGALSPLATIEQVAEDDNPVVTMLVATIKLLPQHVLNPSPITVFGEVEVKLPDSQLFEVPFGTFLYAVDEPTTRPPTALPSSNKIILDSCQCDYSNFACIAEPSPLSPSEPRIQLCLLALPQTSEFIRGSRDVLLVQDSYKNWIVKNDDAVGTGTTIRFKNETLMVIETNLDKAVFERSLNYVEFNSFAVLESASLSNDVNSDLRVPLYTEPSNMPSASPSSSHHPTFDGPTFKPTQSTEPTEEQTIRLEYCPCDSVGECFGAEQITLTPYERNIRICFKALPTNAQVEGTPIVVSNLTIPFTTSLDSNMNGGLITGELPEVLFESSVGSVVEVIGKFVISENGRTANLGLSGFYKIGSVESSAYCSSTTAQLSACACQCNDDNNCIEGMVQTPSSRGKLCQWRRIIVFVSSFQLTICSLYCFIKAVRICVFSAPTGSKIDEVNALYFEYEPGDKQNFEQIVILDDVPADSGTMEPSGLATLRIITASLKDDFFFDLTSARTVEAKGYATVLPYGGAYGQVLEINAVALTIVQESTANPTNVSCQCRYQVLFLSFRAHIFA